MRALMASAQNPRLFDIRTVERNVRKGMLSRKDLEKHLKALPDVADKAQAVHVDEGRASTMDDLDDLAGEDEDEG